MKISAVAIALSAAILTAVFVAPAHAHQPVILDEGDGSPSSGPLLPDGTVSYAVYATVANKQARGFRFRLVEGDQLEVQYLISDEAPDNALTPKELPRVTLIDPKGRRSTLKVNERNEFYEPYSRKNYLYLSRIAEQGSPGTYRVIVRGRSVEPVETTIAVGSREVPGTVVN
ncbi:hypothetical protein LBMAG14_12090 [Actinomycetes bacterium]|nr:hypothetical protein LBMAG14_12090 [Actinomycetes bacterium]